MKSLAETRRQVDDFNTALSSPPPLEQAQSPSPVQTTKDGDAEKSPQLPWSPPEAKEVAEQPVEQWPPGQSPTPAGAKETEAIEARAEEAEPQQHAAGDGEILAASRLANTPMTPCTDFSAHRLGPSRPSQQTGTTVRQRLYYEHAVNLVAARCTSDANSADWLLRRNADGGTDPPPGFGAPRFFYVRQQRPRPMTPLKAWAGYHGNVYFSPLHIEQSSYSDPDELLALPSLQSCSPRLQRVLEASRLNADRLLQLRARAALGPRQPRRRGRTEAPDGLRPVVQLDRAYLASRGSRQGTSMSDSRDVHLYRSAHATGTLQFQPQQLQPPPQPQPHPQHKSAGGRVHRGCVSRKLRHLRDALAPPPSPPPPERPPQHQPQHGGRHDTSTTSLDREIGRLYDRMPSLMASVPKSRAVQHHVGGGRGNAR